MTTWRSPRCHLTALRTIEVLHNTCLSTHFTSFLLHPRTSPSPPLLLLPPLPTPPKTRPSGIAAGSLSPASPRAILPSGHQSVSGRHCLAPSFGPVAPVVILTIFTPSALSGAPLSISATFIHPAPSAHISNASYAQRKFGVRGARQCEPKPKVPRQPGKINIQQSPGRLLPRFLPFCSASWNFV